MHTQLIVVFISGFLALVGIRILISSFDDDDNNDGDGMADLTLDSCQFSSLEGSWHLTISCEIFSYLALRLFNSEKENTCLFIIEPSEDSWCMDLEDKTQGPPLNKGIKASL